MKLPWFRDMWSKSSKDLTPFDRGAIIATGKRFPLFKGKMTKSIEDFRKKGLTDFIYVSRDT
jgi:hypothetical protein